VLFGLSADLPVSLASLAVLGAANTLGAVIRHTLVQVSTPDAMRGRVTAAHAVCTGSADQLGDFEAGVTAAWFGVVPAVVLGGLGSLAVAGLWAWQSPELRRVDRLDREPPSVAAAAGSAAS